MKPKLVLTALLATLLLALGGVLFIHFTNDHKECETVKEYSVSPKDEKIMMERHICRERFAI
ncbi:MAG: hypothetical protein ACLGH8_07830 [Bacteroidia bacterium]